MRPITKDDYPKCPRCGGLIPNNEQPGAYPGALSRVDNKTEVCSECGTLEAIEQFTGGEPMPMSMWVSAEPFASDVKEIAMRS